MMEYHLTLINNETPEVCESCGGRCCKYHPGLYSPKDFEVDGEIDWDLILTGLVLGEYVIDWWDGSPNIYYLRAPSTIDTDVFEDCWTNACAHLTPTGCSLKFKDRPVQCRVLKHLGDGVCQSDGYSKKEIKNEWHPHNMTLKDYGNMARDIREEEGFGNRIEIRVSGWDAE